MRQVARVLEVSRSNLREQLSQSASLRRQRYTKADDIWILPMIRTITDHRPTDGYRRVTQLLNLEFEKQEKQTEDKPHADLPNHEVCKPAPPASYGKTRENP